MSANHNVLAVAPGYLYMTNRIYHGSAGASSSFIKKFLESTPARIAYERENPPERDTSKMDIGSATHTLVLEPHKFPEEFAIAPLVNLRTNAGKDTMADFREKNAHKIILTEEQVNHASLMAIAIKQHPKAAKFLRDCVPEISIYWRAVSNRPECQFDQLVKCRPDALSLTHPLILDIKTCTSASYEAMRKAVINFRYHLSAAHYLEGVLQCEQAMHDFNLSENMGFALICVENTPPYQVATYEISNAFLAEGLSLRNEGLRRLQQAQELGWLSYPPVLRVMEPPRWLNEPDIL